MSGERAWKENCLRTRRTEARTPPEKKKSCAGRRMRVMRVQRRPWGEAGSK